MIKLQSEKNSNFEGMQSDQIPSYPTIPHSCRWLELTPQVDRTSAAPDFQSRQSKHRLGPSYTSTGRQTPYIHGVGSSLRIWSNNEMGLDPVCLNVGPDGLSQAINSTKRTAYLTIGLNPVIK